MAHKQRDYDRDTPLELVRDYKLFAIVCEGGKREPDYFKKFQFLSSKIKVDVIETYITDEEMQIYFDDKSAPRWVLDRAIRYIDKVGLIDEDDLWFVIDRDEWEENQIREIASYCDENPNWHLVISNPCFEVWLYFHMRSDITISESTCCNEFKTEIARFDPGGYNPLVFIQRFQEAIVNAKAADSDKDYFLPKFKETKVYQLGEAVVAKVSRADLVRFINYKIPELIRFENAWRSRRK
jgi:hypothetical protein